MGTDQDGGPAFPDKRPISKAGYATGEFEPVPGMTLRDYFAAKAMVAIISKMEGGICPMDETDHEDQAARGAYGYADAMLAARSA